ncbi:hypothetical protein Goklo_008875, partial [Gossypium klotzschianum]|nr:hypothetical protein [Gossypium klotzschianum]
MATMEEELANLNIVDEEEEPVQTLEDEGTIEEEDAIEEEYNLCLVGRVLTDSVVHFPSMRNILAKLWHPLEGISITEIEEKRILFRFYNKIDLKREGMARQFGNFFGQFIEYGVALIAKGEAVFGWDISLKAPPLRATSVASKWL